MMKADTSKNDKQTPVNCGCGGEPGTYAVPPYRYIKCSKCGIETGRYYTFAEAITAWNKAMGNRAKGEWIDGMPYVNSHWRVCSECHQSAPESAGGYNFCPNCGADMRGENGKA